MPMLVPDTLLMYCSETRKSVSRKGNMSHQSFPISRVDLNALNRLSNPALDVIEGGSSLDPKFHPRTRVVPENLGRPMRRNHLYLSIARFN